MPWIIEQVECWCGKDFMGGLPSNEVAESLAEILRSYRSNDELQGEVKINFYKSYQTLQIEIFFAALGHAWL